MSSSYSAVGTVKDTAALLSYITATFPTALTLTDDNNLIVVTFSSTLTTAQQTQLNSLIASYSDPVVTNKNTAINSTGNSSSALLGSSAVFTGVWEDITLYSTVAIYALAAQASATAGLQAQFGIAAAQADVIKNFTLSANTPVNLSLATAGRFFRLVYTNSAIAQTSFSLQVKYVSGQVETVVDASSTVDDTTIAQVARSIGMNRQDNAIYAVSRADEDRRLRVRLGTDNAVDTKSGFALVQTAFGFNINPEVVTSSLTGAATVTQATGCAVLATAAAATTGAILTSRRYVSVSAGRIIRAIVSCAFSAGVAGNNQLVGVGTAENGFFVGYNGTSFGVMVRSFNVDTWYPQTTFNIDRMNGAGASANTLVPANGNTYMIIYDTTGFGTVSFSLASAGIAVPSALTMHRVALNSSAQPGFRTVSAPLYAQTVNSTNTTTVSVRVASWSAFADNAPAKIGSMRGVDYVRTVSSTNYVPVFSVLNKATFATATNTISVLLRSLAVASDGVKGAVIVGIFDNATLTGATYTDLSTNTTPIAVDNASSSMSGGVLLTSMCVWYGSDRQIDLLPYDISVSPNNSITIAVRCTASGSTTQVSAALTFSHDV